MEARCCCGDGTADADILGMTDEAAVVMIPCTAGISREWGRCRRSSLATHVGGGRLERGEAIVWMGGLMVLTLALGQIVVQLLDVFRLLLPPHATQPRDFLMVVDALECLDPVGVGGPVEHERVHWSPNLALVGGFFAAHHDRPVDNRRHVPDGDVRHVLGQLAQRASSDFVCTVVVCRGPPDAPSFGGRSPAGGWGCRCRPVHSAAGALNDRGWAPVRGPAWGC